MAKTASEETSRGVIASTEEGKLVSQPYREFQPGQAPLKVVTGTQTTSNLSFEIKPGAIVAHEGATVVFVCG